MSSETPATQFVAGPPTPLVLNAFGGPHSGKTTFATALHAHLARAGCRVAFVPEVATRCIQAGDTIGLGCQVYLLGETARHIRHCAERYDFIVVEAPLLLNPVYDKEQSQALADLAIEEHRRLASRNFVLEPVPGYRPANRVHDATTAPQLHASIVRLLKWYGVATEDVAVEGREEYIRRIVAELVPRVKANVLAYAAPPAPSPSRMAGL